MALSRPARYLLALLAMTAPALVVLGTAPPSYAGTLCGTPLALGDCQAPVAEIYRAKTSLRGLDLEPGGRTTADTADIWARPADLADEPAPQKVTYRCRLERDGTVVQDWTSACTEEPSPGTNTAALAHVELKNLPTGTYTLSIRAKDNAKDALGLTDAPNEQPEPGTQFTWTVAEPVDDNTPPNTRLTLGAKRWHLFPYAGFEYVGSEPLESADCTLQGRRRDCDSTQAVIMGLSSGDWVFKVAGRDYAGNPDPTPAVNRFSVPVPSSKLKASRGWQRGTRSGYFFSGYSTTKKKGATLSAARAGTKSVVLVATKCRGCGTVKVTYAGKVLRKVSLAATSTKHRQLVPISSWAAGHGGRVSVTVTSSGKPVTIEGLGFSKRR